MHKARGTSVDEPVTSFCVMVLAAWMVVEAVVW